MQKTKSLHFPVRGAIRWRRREAGLHGFFARSVLATTYSIDFFNGGENDCAELSGHDLLRRPVPISKYEFGASLNVTRKAIVEGHRRTRT